MEIIKNTENTVFDGCDFVVRFDSDKKIKILQLTDMQMIDSSQMRRPDRLREDEISAWRPENVEALCGDHIRSLVAQSRPDLIFVTGDITYGSFDDSGRSLLWFCELMDSFRIPWAPVFGNHDNESRMGVEWQCRQFEKSEYCLFRRGEVSGNGNYTVGIAVGDRLLRVLYMIDSNGCSHSEDESVVKKKGIYPDQTAFIRERAERIRRAQGSSVDGFIAFHIPVDAFIEAETAKGYCTDERELYNIGVDFPASDGDFGCKYESVKKGAIYMEEDFIGLLKSCNINGVFVGHEHKINTCISYKNIMWVYGLKTGQYDYHSVGQLGGTLITLTGREFDVCHLPSLSLYGAYPANAPMFKGFFTNKE